MFNLETAISAWRQQMLAAGIATPTPLDELELHLREEIDRQMNSGLNESAAFEISTRHIGEPASLNREFRKTGLSHKISAAQIGTSMMAFLLGAALMVPGCLQLQSELAIANRNLVVWLGGWFLIIWSLRPFQLLIQHRLAGPDLVAVEMTPVKRTLKTGTGIVVLLTGLALLLPAIGQACSAGLVNFAQLSWAVYGGALLAAGTLFSFHPYKKRKA